MCVFNRVTGYLRAQSPRSRVEKFVDFECALRVKRGGVSRVNWHRAQPEDLAPEAAAVPQLDFIVVCAFKRIRILLIILM